MKHITTLIAVILVAYSVFAQKDMTLKTEKDGVTISYNFSELKGKKAEEGPMQLSLYITNTNDSDKEVSFGLAFYDTGLADTESDQVKVLVKAGKTAKGKKLGLAWLIEAEHKEKIDAGTFDWDLEDLEVKEPAAE